jgi:HD-GYP domain-containing protein (c-di-GMP phosphodiesterase class II)
LIVDSAFNLAVANRLDALIADRPYRGKLPRESVVAILRKERGTGPWSEAVDASERVLN